MNGITLDEIEAEIVVLENQIEFEKEYNKITSSETFKKVFNEVIFGSELEMITKELSEDITEEQEESLLVEIRNLKITRKYISNRKNSLLVLQSRLASAHEIRDDILIKPIK